MKIDIQQLDFIHDTLKKVIKEVEETFGMEFTITSLYRPGATGVHGAIPLRGTDLRCWDEQIGTIICNDINSKFQYDPSRPEMKCAMYHDIGQGAHIHLQVHPNTVSN